MSRYSHEPQDIKNNDDEIKTMVKEIYMQKGCQGGIKNITTS